jgi:hypothetical protein
VFVKLGEIYPYLWHCSTRVSTVKAGLRDFSYLSIISSKNSPAGKGMSDEIAKKRAGEVKLQDGLS